MDAIFGVVALSYKGQVIWYVYCIYFSITCIDIMHEVYSHEHKNECIKSCQGMGSTLLNVCQFITCGEDMQKISYVIYLKYLTGE